MNSRTRRAWLMLGTSLALGIILAGTALAQTKGTSFRIMRSVAAPIGCLEGARGEVGIRALGPVEVMTVSVKGMAPKTEFALFISQLPKEPFGISWYEGDIETNANGSGKARFIGRFSAKSFTIAPDSGPVPVVHNDGPFPDASSNPVFAPIHTYHLTLWFEFPEAASEAGCPDTVTPFGGDHRAGIKALSTRNFPDDSGPLRSIEP